MSTNNITIWLTIARLVSPVDLQTHARNDVWMFGCFSAICKRVKFQQLENRVQGNLRLTFNHLMIHVNLQTHVQNITSSAVWIQEFAKGVKFSLFDLENEGQRRCRFLPKVDSLTSLKEKFNERQKDESVLVVME